MLQKLPFYTILFTLLIQCGIVSASSDWYSNYNNASKEAEKTGKPLLILFVHEGCPECSRMDQILTFSETQKSIENAVKVRLEFMENGELLRQLNVQYTPTLIITSKQYGEVYRRIGALSITEFEALKPSIDGMVSKPEKAEAKSKAVDLDKVEPVAVANTRSEAPSDTPNKPVQKKKTVSTRTKQQARQSAVQAGTQQTESRYTGQRYQIYYPQGYAPAGYGQQ